MKRRLAKLGIIALTVFCASIALYPENQPRAQSKPPAASMKTHAAVVRDVEKSVVGITAMAQARNAGYFGTGAFISSDGHILTSITVVPHDCNVINVFLKGGKRMSGTLVGTIDSLELSIIKIEGSGYSPLAIGKSTELFLGEPIYTFGNCFRSIEVDDRVSISLGSVSGFYDLTEKKGGAEYVGPCIEISAALNPGVDGGPLVNRRGEIIGLLCLNFSPSRWMGVAIPSDALRPHITALMSGKKGEPEKSSALPKSDRFFIPELERAATGLISLKIDRAKDIPTPAVKNPPPQPTPQGGHLAEEAQEFWKRPSGPVTAFIIGKDGWALTSYYNIAGELNSIEAQLPGGKKAAAKLVGWDESKDIALLKIDAKDLPEPVWAADNSYHTGDDVFCLGKSPDINRVTVEEGIVSATGRIKGNCIQLDAKINYGNVGGPVLNRKGEVIGIACHVTNSSRWGQSSGIGFAATWANIKAVLEELKTGKRVKQPLQPFLGVQFDLEAQGIDGARLKEVIADSSADKAGLENGDVVIRANGIVIHDPSDLAGEIRKCKIGDTIALTVVRDGKEIEAKAVLGGKSQDQ